MKARIESEKDFEKRRIEMEKNKVKHDLCDQKIFGTSIGESVEDLVKISLHKDFLRLLLKEWGKRNEKKDNESPEDNKSPEPPKSVELDFKDRNLILHRIQILQYETAESTWVGREIDKITSLGYFIIVISTFFIAISLDSNFADNFLKGFQPSSTVADYQTASLATENQTAAEENIIPRFIIASISGIFLAAVSIMLYFRLKNLNANALTAFKYRIMRDAIKIKRESFDASLKEIEQYLNNGDWILAGDWTNKVMADYVELLRREWVGGINEEKVDKWEKEKFEQREEEK